MSSWLRRTGGSLVSISEIEWLAVVPRTVAAAGAIATDPAMLYHLRRQGVFGGPSRIIMGGFE
jgi:hypothetical protein